MIDAQEILRHISVIMVFMEGLLSFLSPCVLPLLPVYMGYLAGSDDGGKKQSKRHLFFFTFTFIAGIFVAILLMNASVGLISSIFHDHMSAFTRIGGILIIFLGLFQLGVFKSNSLTKTRRLSIKRKGNMNILFSFLMGFSFGFAWTPCVGPALSGILILANSSQDIWISNFLIIVYVLGLTIPFLLVGLFTDRLLVWLSGHMKIMNYTVKAGALILILFGGMMVSGKMNVISNYISKTPVANVQEKTDGSPTDSDKSIIGGKDKNEDENGLSAEDKAQVADDTSKNEANQDQEATMEQEEKQILAQLTAHTLKDQYGNTVQIKDYKGKVLFVNFWATWCPPCQGELPHIQELYDKYRSSDDVAVITIVYPGGQEKNEAGINSFLKEHKMTFPVWMDDGFFYSFFEITSMPTTFMLDRDGKPYGYVKGALTKDMMENMIEQTRKAEGNG